VTIILNGHCWPSQNAAIEHFRKMLGRYVNDEMITAFNDHADLLALVRHYDETAGHNKIGVGVEKFYRRHNTCSGFSSSGFWLRRVDGTETDFSFVQAVRGRARSQEQEFYEACRIVVAEDIGAAKAQVFAEHADATGCIPCELTGQPLSFDRAQVDHADPTFRQLVSIFRALQGWRRITRPRRDLSIPPLLQPFANFITPLPSCESSPPLRMLRWQEANGDPASSTRSSLRM
jgi:Protein of unknown function (DUF3223)